MEPFVIFNPTAGRAGELARLREALARALPGTEIRATRAAGEATELARRAVREGRDPVVAAGGDGLVAEVVEGMAPDFARLRLGLLPVGTGNDLARSLSLPDDPEGAVEVLRRGVARSVDIVRLRWLGEDSAAALPRYLVNAAVAGFAGRVARRVDARSKRRWGSLAYRRAAVAELPSLRAYDVSLAADGERLRLDAYAAVVANGRYVGGGLPLAPGASLEDGLVDVSVIPVLGPLRLARLVARVLAGRDPGPDVIRLRAHAGRLELRPAMDLNVDGEDVEAEGCEFEVLPSALRIVAP